MGLWEYVYAVEDRSSEFWLIFAFGRQLYDVMFITLASPAGKACNATRFPDAN
jgi:hypothetical protein